MASLVGPDARAQGASRVIIVWSPRAIAHLADLRAYIDELAKARSIKQGMMQELLTTGRVRLPVDGARTVG